MPISIYTARQFNPKNIGTIYTLRYPEDGFIFYVGKTLGNPKYRLQAHISEANSKTNEFINLRKKKIITGILSNGKRPIMGIIEQIKIWTNYDSMFYDSQELYWINQYFHLLLKFVKRKVCFEIIAFNTGIYFVFRTIITTLG